MQLLAAPPIDGDWILLDGIRTLKPRSGKLRVNAEEAVRRASGEPPSAAFVA